MNKKTSASLDDYTVFRLLCELEKGDVSSQRDLATRLDAALGLVNLYLKSCADSGLIRVKETVSAARTGRYALTPKGAAEKRRLAIHHARYIDEIIKVIAEEYRRTVGRLKELGVERVALCGVGQHSLIPAAILHEAGISIAAVMDTQGTGVKFMGREVVSVAHGMLSGVHKVLITSFSRSSILYIALLDMGAEPENIFVPQSFLEQK